MPPDARDARRRRLFGSLLAVVFLPGLSRVAFAPPVKSPTEAFDAVFSLAAAGLGIVLCGLLVAYRLRWIPE